MICIFTPVKSQNKTGFETMVNALLSGKVDTLSSASLSGKTQATNVVLLDTREAEEYEVSHLSGAIHVGYKSFDEELVADLPKDAEIVVYCSVGKRSEEIGDRLKKMGFTDVQNLWGGIFDWTNRGYPVVDTEGDEVCRVHPYSLMWGLWINKCEKTYESR
ncbi:MAG: rhodanese-like domain-containing protein [Cryomorphaceae bacterium]